MLAFDVITVAGIVLRTGWGRILGVIACGLSLIQVPSGTVIGLF